MSTVKVNQTSSGVQDTEALVSGVWSPDGRQVAFSSKSDIYVTGDTNGTSDVFVKDLISGAIARVSTAADGTQANGYSNVYGFSPDGSTILFASDASNLVRGDTNRSFLATPPNSGTDIFVKDLRTGAITRVSTSAQDGEGDGQHDLDDVTFSPDGRQVAFSSASTNLVPGDTNNTDDIFVKTVAGPNAGAISRVSTASDGTQGNGYSWGQSFSADGTKVLFTSEASNLVAGDTNNARDAFVKDLASGTIERVSVGPNGAEIASGARGYALSPDGTKILFASAEKNLTGSGDNGAATNVYMRDIRTGGIELISSNRPNAGTEVYNRDATFSPDGSKVVFYSYEAITGQASGATRAYIKDLASGTLSEFKPTLPDQTAAGSVDRLEFSPDGKSILFSVFPTRAGDPSGLFVTDEVPCYASGTRIETPHGPVAVEDLSIGDLVWTASGEQRAIHWIGHRKIDCARHPRPEAVWPVRVQAHAFGPDLPARDLWLSPDHAVRVTVLDEVLIPIKHLVNGATVAQMPRDSVTYWHVELDSHDILLAEGLPAESFLDTGVRACFANGAEHSVLHPDFTPLTRADFCRPLIQDGPIVEAVRQRLVARAFALGWTTTAEPDLCAWVDGVLLRPEMEGPVAIFEFPAAADDVRLASRSFVPEHSDPGCRDGRRLGVPMRHVSVIDETGITRTLPIGSDLLNDGFNFLEGDATDPWRWTDGNAVVPAALWAGCRGPFQLRITTAPDRGTPRAWMPPTDAIEVGTEVEEVRLTG